jgi:hypothetical protein
LLIADCGKTLIKLTSKITTMEITFSMVLHINMFNMVGMIKIISFTSCKNNQKLCFEGDSFMCLKAIVYNIQRTKLTINRLKMITNVSILKPCYW